MPHAWTREEEQRIVDGRNEGKRIVDIANEMGIPYKLVECKVKHLRAAGRLQHSDRFWSPEMETEGLRLSRSGRTAREIAEILGKTPESVRSKLSFLRITDSAGNEFSERKKANYRQNQRFVELMLQHHPELETKLR